MRTFLATGMAALALLGATAGTASAKSPKGGFTYTATINCGGGAIVVGSTDDLFAPLVDMRTGRKYQPIAWDVWVDGQEIVADDGHRPNRHAVGCSYDDGVAKGTVTVKRA
jgi:hypothetical protein